MGNCLGCCLCSTHNRDAVLIDSRRGSVRKLKLPVKAAEVMMDDVGQIIVALEQLRLTRRVLPLRAEEDLVPGKTYASFPISRANSHLTEKELDLLAEAEAGKKQGGSRVKPDITEVSDDREISLEGEEVVTARQPWRPALQTIIE